MMKLLEEKLEKGELMPVTTALRVLAHGHALGCGGSVSIDHVSRVVRCSIHNIAFSIIGGAI